MKKITLIILLVTLTILIGCSKAEKLSPTYEELQEQLIITITERDSLATELEELKDQIKAEIEEEIQETIVQIDDVEIEVIGWVPIKKDRDKWVFSNHIEITLLVKNNTEKDIKGISGTLTTNDMFGKEIKTADCDLAQHVIPAMDSLEIEMVFMCNEFVAADNLLFITELENLDSIYNVKQIVFSDGTTKTSN